jgi:tetratricopeptide (TPR) repeat protein
MLGEALCGQGLVTFNPDLQQRRMRLNLYFLERKRQSRESEGEMMSDVILQSLITSGFWLTAFLVFVIAFRTPVASIIGSLSKFSIAGATFELRDSTATLKSAVLLGNVLVDILSERESAEKFYSVVSQASAQQLVRFIQQYMDDVAPERQNVEMVKNVALLIGRKRQYQVAIGFYDKLLERYHGDADLLYLKARTLRDNGFPEAAEQIYEELERKIPTHSGVWFGRARTRSLLGKFPESLSDLKRAIELEYWKGVPKMLDDQQLEPLRKAEPEQFKRLRDEVAKLRSNAATG